MQKRHFSRATLVAAALAITLPFGAMAFRASRVTANIMRRVASVRCRAVS